MRTAAAWAFVVLAACGSRTTLVVAVDAGPPPPPKCGNGVVETGEACDDGNLVDGDGCSAHCGPDTCGDGVV